MAPTVRLTLPGAPDPPLVLSSTTTMSFPELAGELGVSGIAFVPEPRGVTTNVCVLESVPSGFCSCTEIFPVDCRSDALSDVAHSVIDAQEVGRALPAIKIVEPGPGADAEKLFPVTSIVKPPCEPAYALVGERSKILGPLVIVTAASPIWLVSSALVAAISIKSGTGAPSGAVNNPDASIEPHPAGLTQAGPPINQVTCWSAVPTTLAVNRSCSVPAIATLPG